MKKNLLVVDRYLKNFYRKLKFRYAFYGVRTTPGSRLKWAEKHTETSLVLTNSLHFQVRINEKNGENKQVRMLFWYIFCAILIFQFKFRLILYFE